MSSAYDAIAGEPRSAERGLTNRFAGGKEVFSATVKEAGITNLAKPLSTQQVTLYWIALSASQENTGEVLAVVELAPWTPYAWYLGNPGAFMHWEKITGATGASLTLELSGAQNVAVSIAYTIDFPRNE